MDRSGVCRAAAAPIPSPDSLIVPLAGAPVAGNPLAGEGPDHQRYP